MRLTCVDVFEETFEFIFGLVGLDLEIELAVHAFGKGRGVTFGNY